MTTTFQVGKTYTTRSICDSECIFKITVLARTAKSISVKVHGREVRRGVTVRDGVEECFAFGKYSMCPVFRAGREG